MHVSCASKAIIMDKHSMIRYCHLLLLLLPLLLLVSLMSLVLELEIVNFTPHIYIVSALLMTGYHLFGNTTDLSNVTWSLLPPWPATVRRGSAWGSGVIKPLCQRPTFAVLRCSRRRRLSANSWQHLRRL
jgi:hypothetical protein